MIKLKQGGSMKKRIYIFISLLVIAVITFVIFKMFLSKPKNRETINLKSNQEILNGYIYETRNKFVDDDDIEQRTIVCDALKKVKYVDEVDRYIITTDDELYELNLSKKYSTTNQNCQKVTDLKIKNKIYDIYIGEDNKMYQNYEEGLKERMERYNGDLIILDMLSRDDVVSIREIKSGDYALDNSPFVYEILKSDGKIYECEIVVINKEVKILKQEIKYEIPGEIIKKYKLSYSDIEELGPSHTYIITDKGFYTSKLKNSECEDYVDIKCEYEYIKEEYFSRKVNEIALMLGYSGYTRWGELNYYNSDGKFVSIKKTAK